MEKMPKGPGKGRSRKRKFLTLISRLYNRCTSLCVKNPLNRIYFELIEVFVTAPVFELENYFSIQ